MDWQDLSAYDRDRFRAMAWNTVYTAHPWTSDRIVELERELADARSEGAELRAGLRELEGCPLDGYAEIAVRALGAACPHRDYMACWTERGRQCGDGCNCECHAEPKR